MDKKLAQGAPEKMQTETQFSAGGVVVRLPRGAPPEMVLVAVGRQGRWQLPKGLIEPGETPEQAAKREVQEEAGVEGVLVAPLKVVEYWYVSTHQETRIRFHKFVHFFLFHYVSGDVAQHDHEVSEARWVTFADAIQLLKFASERQVVARAQALVEAGSEPQTEAS